MMPKKISNPNNFDLFQDLSVLIEESRNQVAIVANSALTLLFWKVGKRISDEILKNERAEYGKQISRKAFERSEIANIQQQTQTDNSLRHTFKDPYLPR